MLITLRKIAVLFTFSLLGLTVAKAQDWELGLQGGLSGYQGELNQSNPLAFNDWAIGLIVRKNLSRNWALRLNLLRANTHGDAAKNSNVAVQEQKLYFKSPIYEASLVGEFNFFKFEPSYTRISYTPYVFAGIGGFHFQPKSYSFDGNLVGLHDYYTENVDYSRMVVSIPFGVGFRYNLRGPLTLGLEIGYRVAFTDYLDDISGNYIDANFDAKGNMIAEEEVNQRSYFIDPSQQMPIGTQRGDGRKNDSYMLATITVTYAIFRAGCPVYIKKN